jgi:hypothetical protein
MNPMYRWAVAAAIIAASARRCVVELDPLNQPTGRALVQDGERIAV